MQTTNNGIKIPDNPTNSNDKFADIINAIISNGNIMNTINGNISTAQTDYPQGYIKFTNGFMLQWGHPPLARIGLNGEQAVARYNFPTPFTQVCIAVVGSDAGHGGMSFGFYDLNRTGFTWCTGSGVGTPNAEYAPNFLAFGI